MDVGRKALGGPTASRTENEREYYIMHFHDATLFTYSSQSLSALSTIAVFLLFLSLILRSSSEAGKSPKFILLGWKFLDPDSVICRIRAP